MQRRDQYYENIFAKIDGACNFQHWLGLDDAPVTLINVNVYCLAQYVMSQVLPPPEQLTKSVGIATRYIRVKNVVKCWSQEFYKANKG